MLGYAFARLKPRATVSPASPGTWLQPHFLRHAIERRQVGREHLLQPVGLRLQLALDVVEDHARVARRPAVAGFDDAQERRETVVDPDGEVQRILIALVLRLIDLFFDNRQRACEPVRDRAQIGVVFFLQPVVHLLLDAADLNHGVVRLVDLVANLACQVELRLQVGLGRFVIRVLLHRERLRLRLAVDGEPHLIRAGQRDRTVCRRAPQHHARERNDRLVLQVPREMIQARGDVRRLRTASPAPFFIVGRQFVAATACLRGIRSGSARRLRRRCRRRVRPELRRGLHVRHGRRSAARLRTTARSVPCCRECRASSSAAASSAGS